MQTKLTEIISNAHPSLSFEVFPPKKAQILKPFAAQPSKSPPCIQVI